MTTHRDMDDLEPYLYAARAVKIVNAAADTMKPAEIAVALDVSESTIRMWRGGKVETVEVKTARKLRRLERRIGK